MHIYNDPRFHWWLSSKGAACKKEMQDTRPWAEKVPWRRAWQCTPVFLPEESQGQRRLVSYSSWGPKESDMTKVTECACILIQNAPSVYGQSV